MERFSEPGPYYLNTPAEYQEYPPGVLRVTVRVIQGLRFEAGAVAHPACERPRETYRSFHGGARTGFPVPRPGLAKTVDSCARPSAHNYPPSWVRGTRYAGMPGLSRGCRRARGLQSGTPCRAP
jgi:hypothetical protein